jgi:hypothetical protein
VGLIALGTTVPSQGAGLGPSVSRDQQVVRPSAGGAARPAAGD